MYTYDGVSYRFSSVTFTCSPNVKVMAINRKTGHLFINLYVWQRAGRFARRFMLCHEEAHYLYDISDEIDTDEMAFVKYVSTGAPLSESVKVLLKKLSKTDLEHRLRILLQLDRALKYDYLVNGNQRARRTSYLSTNDAKKIRDQS